MDTIWDAGQQVPDLLYLGAVKTGPNHRVGLRAAK